MTSKATTDKRVALVTGASAGIGKAIVRRLLGDGWTVYGAARRMPEMADIAAAGAQCLALDVCDDPSMQSVVDEILRREGRIDALVNNAGYGAYGAIEDVPIADARRQFEVNVFGLARLSQLVLPSMRAARSGCIVNISSMGGRIWMPIGGWYHATKHAVEVLSDAMRVEVAPFGVKVVLIEPGAIESEWSGISARNLRAASKDSVYREPVETMATVLEHYEGGAKPEVIADVVSRALHTRHPRRRYAAPFDARALIFLHWLLPTAVWERVIGRGLRNSAKRALSKTVRT